MTAPIASGRSESPGGPCTHWKAPPFHGARRKRPFVSSNGADVARAATAEMRVRHVSLSADAITPSEQSIARSLFFEVCSEMKALVPVGRNLITFLLVGGDAADIRHEDAGLFRNIGPDVP